MLYESHVILFTNCALESSESLRDFVLDELVLFPFFLPCSRVRNEKSDDRGME